MSHVPNQYNTSRPYDDFIPSALLKAIKERRHTPDGVPHPIKEVRRAGRLVYVYPWPKMLLGDFFVVPLHSRSEQSVRTACYQAAARFDFEISIVKVDLPTGGRGLRVTVTIIEVSRWKRLAEQAGVKGIRWSDGRWKARRRDWEKRYRHSQRQPSPVQTSPFWADNDPELPTPDSIADPAPYVKLSREEIIRRALGGED